MIDIILKKQKLKVVRMKNIMAMMLASMMASGEYGGVRNYKPREKKKAVLLPSDKKVRQLHEFTVKGQKIMACSKKDAIIRLRHGNIEKNSGKS